MPRFIVTTELDGQTRHVDLSATGARLDDDTEIVLVPSDTTGVWHMQEDGRRVPVHIHSDGLHTVTVSIRGYAYTARVLHERHAELLDILRASPAQQQRVTRLAAPMPGLLKHIHVQEGAPVRKGDTLFTLEAMKMENAIKSPAEGIVRHLTISGGAAVEKGALLCTIEPS